MTSIERLAAVKFDLIKLALNKKFDIREYKELKENLLLTDQMLKQNRLTKSINEQNINNIETYILSKKGR
jgi:hypothetical protein